eukprot:SAG31_NODE_1857_length_7062_cov_6.624587_5_plen_64_part_00
MQVQTPSAAVATVLHFEVPALWMQVEAQLVAPLLQLSVLLPFLIQPCAAPAATEDNLNQKQHV